MVIICIVTVNETATIPLMRTIVLLQVINHFSFHAFSVLQSLTYNLLNSRLNNRKMCDLSSLKTKTSRAQAELT